MLGKLLGQSVENKLAGEFMDILKVMDIPPEFLPQRKEVSKGIAGLFSKNELKETDLDVLLFGYLSQVASDVIGSDAYGGHVAMYSEALVRFGNRLEKKFQANEHRIAPSDMPLVNDAYQNMENARAGLAFKI